MIFRIVDRGGRLTARIKKKTGRPGMQVPGPGTWRLAQDAEE